MASNTIDLDRAEQAVASLTFDKQQEGYQPKTLNEHNNTRVVYLPLFPTKSFGPNNHLLLANVSVTRLAPHEITRRQHGASTTDALTMMNNYDYSKNEEFTLSEEDAQELAARLHVGLSIITFNAERLRSICYYLMELHKLFRRNILQKEYVALEEPIFNSKQMTVALEFYLQMDVDLFYMKTCSFRGAEPRSILEGLFCGKDEPKAPYELTPCNNLFCPCCHPRNHWRKSESRSVVDFQSSSMHQFVNGYTTYLNCPATCTTSNIIYVMTCPCGHYEYVDSTAETLGDAMTFHRKHGNRIIHQKLTGSSLFPGMTLDPNEQENEMANKMRLYEHSSRCPVALDLFLDVNPDYWCFIPLLWHDAQVENIAFFEESSSTSSRIVDIEATNIIAMAAIHNRRVTRCLDTIPLTPARYAFSYEQRKKQRLFFEQFLSSPVDQLPYSPVDLYKMTIIAVLPDDGSMMLRYILETLFIIHGETKLNMICPIGGDPEKRYGRPYTHVWCANLNCPFVVTPTSNH